ncbi:MAG: Ig-like domain-containing protein [Eubacteriales bacterium]|nr:Ig-like domain-containing protein [Eubacteriales bacterium]
MKRFAMVLLAVFLMIGMAAAAEENRSISITATETIVYTGKKIALAATVEQLSEDAPIKTALVWKSSDKDIANVNSKGMVTGVAAGKATITCYAKDDESLSAAIEVDVRAAVKTLTLEDKRITLLLGAGEEMAQASLGFSILPENAYDRTVSWTSSDESVAAVDANGTVRAIGSGEAVVSVKSNDPSMSKASKCTVTVGQAVSNIEISESAVTIEKKKKYTPGVSVLPEDALNTKVNWASSDEGIVKVSAKGIISAVGTGTATVTCTAADGSGISNTCEITVVQKATKVSSKTKRLVVFEDRASKLSVSVSPSDVTDKTVQWSSSNSYVASVESDGTVTAKNAGEAVITATAADGSGKKCNIKVIVEPVNPISLESIGFGIYLPNLLGLTVENRCKTKTITDFNFDMTLYSYSGTTIDDGSYSLGKATKIGAKKTKTIKRTVFGVGYATKVVITITGVTFSDGTYYSIPSSQQDTWSFRR